MTTLFDVSGIRARIFILPNRPPFMIAPDLAEVYLTTVKRLGEAVSRNPARFPERYAFRLTEAEEQQRWSQFATTSPGKRTDLRPLVFTHGGANMLASVLRGDVADRMSVAINDAFTEMEARALADARDMVGRLQVEAQRKKPVYGFIAMSLQAGLSLDQMWRNATYPRWKLEQAAREMLAMRLTDRLPAGMQPDLFYQADRRT